MSNKLALMPSTDERTWMKELATLSVKSGLLPKAVSTPEKAIIIQMYARAHEIDAMIAFSEIYVVNGKPSMSVKLKMSLVSNRIPGAYVQVVESTNTACKAVGYRPNREKMTYTFTIEQAKQAGLTGKDIWRNYPDKMLMWRACGTICDIMFPDVCTMGTAHPDDQEPIKIDVETKKPVEKKEIAAKKVKPTPQQTLEKVLKKEVKPIEMSEIVETEVLGTTVFNNQASNSGIKKTSFEDALRDSQANMFRKKD